MLSQLQQFVNSLNRPKYYLLAGNILLVAALIILSNLKIVPLRTGDFAFFAVITLAFALYRPGWAFLFFVGTIPLENINLAPESLGIAIRPYQFVGALAITALLIRFFSKRLFFKPAKFNLADWLVIVLVAAGFLSAFAAVGAKNFLPLRLAVIFASFAALYFLARNYIQTLDDLKKVLPFFLSSGAVVTFYGIWQNWRFTRNLPNFEVMPGRPNSVFSEPDWLGMYLVLLISIVYVLIYYYIKQVQSSRLNRMFLEKQTHSQYPDSLDTFTNKQDFPELSGSGETPEPALDQILNLNPIYHLPFTNYFSVFGIYVLLNIFLVLLVITVSRSAWLGAFAATFIFLFVIFTNLKFSPKEWRWKETFYLKLKILASLLVALAAVYVFNLTDFQLFNRAKSTGTGLQKITVACEPDCNVETRQCLVSTETIISNISELEQYDCRHINLEEIESEKAKNNIIAEIYREDPNVNIRGEIYRKSWQEIKKHPIMGIGWGSIGSVLGQDERGATFNSSNIFLETWLGAGILGLASLLALFSYILLSAIKNYFYACDQEGKVFHLFIIISWFAIIIPNLFNAGIFLGFLWVWLAITQIKE